MRRVLVTGASGLIGTPACRQLIKQGFDVHAVTAKSEPPSDESGICWHRADLLDADQVVRVLEEVRPADLLHLAWETTPPGYWTSERNFDWVQVSMQMIRHFHQFGGQRVVVAGTCAEYSWEHGLCSEDRTPMKPTSLYGACKLALQQMLAAYSRQVGLSSAWGRVFFLYGPGEAPNRLVPSVIRSLLQGEEAACTHGRQIRDYLYVEDVADAFVRLLRSDVQGPVNIASGQPVTLREVVLQIAEGIGRPELLQIGRIAVRNGEPPLIVADVKRLREEVGWVPRYSLDEGLRETIQHLEGRL
ncbi:MAG: NAD(P)-dependent oxidoreductase [Tumebacillaceae bacterium]